MQRKNKRAARGISPFSARIKREVILWGEKISEISHWYSITSGSAALIPYGTYGINEEAGHVSIQMNVDGKAFHYQNCSLYPLPNDWYYLQREGGNLPCQIMFEDDEYVYYDIQFFADYPNGDGKYISDGRLIMSCRMKTEADRGIASRPAKFKIWETEIPVCRIWQ